MPKKKSKPQHTDREIVTVAKAKASDKKRSTVATNIKYDRVTDNFIVAFNRGRIDGKTIREHKSFPTLKEAKDALAIFEADKVKGLVKPQKIETTMGECIKEFINRSSIEMTTSRGYGVIERRIKRTELYDKKVVDIRKIDIDNYISTVKKNTTLSNTTINKDVNLIRSTLQFAISREYIFYNYACGVTKLKETKTEPQPLTIEELHLLHEKVLETHDWRLIVPVMLASCHGLRRGEIVGLKWNMVSFKDNTIKICETITQMGSDIIHKQPKTERSKRTLELIPQTRDILQKCMEYQKEQGLYGEYVVINSDGEAINPTFLSKSFKYFLVKHKLREIRFHDLRHTFGTRAIEAGANPLDVSGAMGHASLATTVDINYPHTNNNTQCKAA